MCVYFSSDQFEHLRPHFGRPAAAGSPLLAQPNLSEPLLPHEESELTRSSIFYEPISGHWSAHEELSSRKQMHELLAFALTFLCFCVIIYAVDFSISECPSSY